MTNDDLISLAIAVYMTFYDKTYKESPGDCINGLDFDQSKELRGILGKQLQLDLEELSERICNEELETEYSEKLNDRGFKEHIFQEAIKDYNISEDDAYYIERYGKKDDCLRYMLAQKGFYKKSDVLNGLKIPDGFSGHDSKEDRKKAEARFLDNIEKTVRSKTDQYYFTYYWTKDSSAGNPMKEQPKFIDYIDVKDGLILYLPRFQYEYYGIANKWAATMKEEQSKNAFNNFFCICLVLFVVWLFVWIHDGIYS